jgi:DNA-directed RNA polymerase subunit beta
MGAVQDLLSMYSLPKNIYRERIDFSKINTTVPIPNLIEIQKKSYERFLQMNRLPSEREDVGLQSVFKSVFPISDFRENSSLEFIEYSIGNWECKCGKLAGLHHLRKPCAHCGATLIAEPYGDREVLCGRCGKGNHARGDVCDICGQTVALKLKYDVDECQERGMTYAVPLKVTIRLVVWNKDAETGVKTIRDIKEQEVYFGDIPLMTEHGTFIINGTERVIVSQLHRSPGAFFHEDRAEKEFVGQIIPYRGSWVEFKYDQKNLLYVSVDRKRKFLATVFLRALGLQDPADIIRTFYTVHHLILRDNKVYWTVDDTLVGKRARQDVQLPDGRVLVAEGRKITAGVVGSLREAGIEAVEIESEALTGAFAAADVVNPETGEVLLEANEPLDQRVLSLALEQGVGRASIFFPETDEVGPVLSNTLRKDEVKTHKHALVEIYKRLRQGDPISFENIEPARLLFENMFFNPQKYDFSRVGRLKLNTKLGLHTPLDEKILHPQDFYEVIRYLLKLRKNPLNVDDIDHLGNRRVRSVGELLENQFRIGLVRMERAIKEKMSVYQEMATAMPHDLINAKPVMAAIREFFGSSQLSQFMDQTNPLSEITHKRRLSALGPGGLSRERAGFEVRDVHPTHYGRICPIETPEGPNIGLISSLSCYSRINEFGFIESPYRRVKDGRVVDYVQITNTGGSSKYKVGDIVEASQVVTESGRAKKGLEYEPYSYYLSAWEEDQYVIAQANVELDPEGRLKGDRVNARKAGDFILSAPTEVEFIDVSPKQLVSVAASLIPFLENDDANRALMGSNMQRQAVPLLQARSPYVGTGMEYITARDSGAVVLARRSGTVDYVDSQRILVRVEGEEEGVSKELGADIYNLTKFKRSNQNTCINQRPIVRGGQKVVKGQVLADGPCTEQGELALGRNVLVAFMPWRGYNFEDAILVSERLVKDDYYTSIHIEEFEIEARDTKLGPEEITRDIPNVSETYLRDLDDSGIIRIGAYVKPGDILVGKVTPKGETQLTPEEKLLRAIFGEKAGDVRDASLICPPGIEGIIVGVKIFSRKGIEKDDRAKAIEQDELDMMEKNLQDEIRILHDEVKKRIVHWLRGQTLRSDLFDEFGRERVLRKGATLSDDVLMGMPYEQLVRVRIDTDDAQLEDELRELEDRTARQVEVIRQIFEEKKEKIRRGDELPPGVIKLVKAYVAMKRKLSVGDKMAGRHGNKGVIARILAEEDMPYLPDGTPVEIVLNPLGVPSRMNVGQILETHLGWAAHGVGEQIDEALRQHEAVQRLRELLAPVRGEARVKAMADEEVLEAAASLRAGLHFATPVFDGATEREIKAWLDRAGKPASGKTVLYDGMTGTAFEQNVTVGYIYMLKLSHLVDDKIHARSIGPYSLITQQPLGGKAQFGGQRFGEMEVWALEAYGASHILQELLTAKSDDVTGRAKIYEAIVKGDASYTPGLPESFNVLIRELQSLCLDVELLKTRRKPQDTPPPAEEEPVLEQV